MFSDSKKLHRNILPALLALALLFSVVEFVLIAILIHNYGDRRYPSDTIKDRLYFVLFTTIWSLVLLPVYIFANMRLPRQVLSSVGSNIAFITFTWSFWVAGAAAWSAAIGGTLHCGNLGLYNPHLSKHLRFSISDQQGSDMASGRWPGRFRSLQGPGGSVMIALTLPYCHSLRAVQAFSWMIAITITFALAYIGGVATRDKKQPVDFDGPMGDAKDPV